MSDNECFNCDEPMVECECGETEGYSRGEIICPYCGYGERPEGDAGVYDEGETEYCCPSCNKDFEVSTVITYSWTTTKLREAAK